MLFAAIFIAGLVSASRVTNASVLPNTIVGDLPASAFLAPQRVPIAQATNISEKCLRDTELYLNALHHHQPWAISMYESSGKLEFDLMSTGTKNVHHDVGLFDDCLEIHESDIYGQYCSVFFKLERVEPEEMDAFLIELKEPKIAAPSELYSQFQHSSASFCMPSSCTAADLQKAVAQQVGRRVLDGNYSIVTITDDNYCYSKAKKEEFNTATLIVMIVFACLFILIAVATAHECASTSAPKKSVLHGFSLVRNVRSLISTRTDIKDNLSCLHGLRVCSTFFIVFLHVAEHGVNRSIYNKRMTLQNSYRWDTQLFSNGLIAVDTFFLISGLLVAYTQLRNLKANNGQFGVVRFYVRRWLRVTPLLAAMVAIIATLYAYSGTGPDWHYVRLISRSVREYWWTYLLYINNYVPYVESYLSNPLTGLPESWYLACDMQMFWLSPLFIYPLWRWKRAGLALTIVALAALLGINLAVFAIKDLPASLMYSRPSDFLKANDFFRIHYMQTYARLPPYLIGILLGWTLFNTKNKKQIFGLNWVTATIGWVLAALVGALVIFGLIPYLNEDEVPLIDPIVRVSYGAMHRAAWGLVMGWVVFACSHGYGGFIHKFLSWKFFLPFSRLAYAIFIIHYSYIRAFTSQSRTPVYFSEMYFFTIYLGCLFAVILLAAVAYLFVELPFLNIEKLIFTNRTPKRNGIDQKVDPVDAKKIAESQA